MGLGLGVELGLGLGLGRVGGARELYRVLVELVVRGL